MKLIVDGEYFAINGLVLSDTDDTPDKCDDWDAEFGSEFEDFGFGGFPEKVDLRHLMTPVENQKEINSCTANAVAGAYEYLCNVRARQTGDEPGDISRLFIYYVTRKLDQMRRGQAHLRVKDSGSTISGAIDALLKKGACLEETYLYDPACVNHTPPAETYDEALDYKVSKCWKVRTDVGEFKYVLSKGYPIIFGCKLFEPFMLSRGRGIVPTPDPSDRQAKVHGLHAMLIVGYYESHQVFVVRNSWGEDWGYGGYCFMPYDYIANSEFNLGQNFAIRGLTDYDFTPDEDGCGDFPAFGEEEPEEPPVVEILGEESEGSCDDEEEEEEDFDPNEFFSALAEAKKVFDKFDLDESGYMDTAELAIALMMNGHYVTDEIVAGILEEYDEDGSGKLGFSEFLKILEIEVPEEDEDCNGEEEGGEEEEEGCEDDEEEEDCEEDEEAEEEEDCEEDEEAEEEEDREEQEQEEEEEGEEDYEGEEEDCEEEGEDCGKYE